MLCSELFEGRDTPLYHATNLQCALSILEDGIILKSDTDRLSVTRDIRYRYYTNDFGDVPGIAPIQFVLNQAKIIQRYKIEPIDYWVKSGHSKIPGRYSPDWTSESEESIFINDGPGLDLKFVSAIILEPLPRNFPKYAHALDTQYFDEYLQKDTDYPERHWNKARDLQKVYDIIIKLATKRGIQVIDKRGIKENASAGATSSASVATVVGGLGAGFSDDMSKSIYGKKKKPLLLRRVSENVEEVSRYLARKNIQEDVDKQLKKGDIFIHSKWLDENNKPLRCQVTKISQGVVYWRPLDGGKPMYFPIEQQNRWVKDVELPHNQT